MTNRIGLTRSLLSPKYLLAITGLTLLILACTVAVTSADDEFCPLCRTLVGTAVGNGSVQPGYAVSLYASGISGWPEGFLLGTDTTDADGKFEIHYRLRDRLWQGSQPVLFVMAERGPVMLAGAIGTSDRSYSEVVVNERTTVATGTAFAQFVNGHTIRGNTYGMVNAVKMAENMANPGTGDVGEVLYNEPNGMDTSTYRTFNSLANVVASCVADDAKCDDLFRATTPPGEPATTTVLQAVANMIKYPSQNLDDLFALSFENQVYTPALAIDERPTSWLLFLKFTGGAYSEQDAANLMNGPGSIAIDERGFAWINDNYVPKAPTEIACSGLRLLKFYPWGKSFEGSPYFGGGLSGAGFGIGLDPRGNVWVGNFGFEAQACTDENVPPFPDPQQKIPAPHNSVSLFLPNGIPLSSSAGITAGDIWWPQATVADRQGNIWIANCGNDSVTFIPKGRPRQARNFLLPGAGTRDDPLIKPFGIAIDPKGRAWVTGNKADEVYRIEPDGVIEMLDSPPDFLSKPMGISGDSSGNMYVSSSDTVNIVCVDTALTSRDGKDPSIGFYPADGGDPLQFKGGGLTVPWGNAIDGNDTLWVFNFGAPPLESGQANEPFVTGISRFCGTGKCPAGLHLGDAISPDTGYTSDALERITSGSVDPSGNLWLLNNWRKDGPLYYDTNPGGNSFVIVPGAAAPIKTPLIGPPRSFGG